MIGDNWIGTILVADLILALLCYISFESLKVRLSSVPEQAAILAQQIATISVENQSALMLIDREAEQAGELQRELDSVETRFIEAQKTLNEIQNRLPAIVYVLDQIIQANYQPWLILVRRGDPKEAAAGSLDAEWANGRRMLVFADNAANVRRRIEVRYPPAQGYMVSDPQLFEIT